MTPIWTDKYNRKYNYPPAKEEVELNESLHRAPRAIFKISDKLIRSPIPQIILTENLSTDPCIDDIDVKTENLSGSFNKIVIGLIIGLILLKVIK